MLLFLKLLKENEEKESRIDLGKENFTFDFMQFYETWILLVCLTVTFYGTEISLIL